MHTLGRRIRHWFFSDLQRFPTEQSADAAEARVWDELKFSPGVLTAWACWLLATLLIALGPQTWPPVVVNIPFFVGLVVCPILFKRKITRLLWRQLAEYGVPCCIACGYNLTGNVSGVCPECGTKIEAR